MNDNQGISAPTQPSAPAAQRPGGSSPLDLEVAKLTDTGRSRPHNEDYVEYYIPQDAEERDRKGAICLVADGMGGHNAGEVASRAAVELARQEYLADATHDTGTSLVRAFRAANQRLYEWAQTDPSKAGMGTTLVVAVILGRKVFVANVGDSRAYLINQAGITRITTDHSWVEEQIQAGLLTREQARKHPQRNVVTRALGSKPQVEVDLFEGEMNEGDSLLLCTDGLTGLVEDRELAAIVQQHPPQEAARLLVDQANERGGNDNIGVVVVGTRKMEVAAPTQVSESPKQPLIWRLIWTMAALAGILLCTLAVLGGYWWFAIRPTPTPTALPPMVSTPTAGTPIATSATLEPLAPTATLATLEAASPTIPETPGEPTATLRPTSSAPTATPTLAPERTRQPTRTPQPTVTPTPYPAPTLLNPGSGGGLSGKPSFVWQWNQAALPADHYFDLRIWSEKEQNLSNNQKRGAIAPTKNTRAEVDLEGVPAISDYGTGTYYWTVVVVQKLCADCDPTIAGQWGEERMFVYSSPSEGGGDEGDVRPPPTTGG